jgi:hypothetical protein
MNRTTAALTALMALTVGCSKYPYVSLLDGVWTGNANDASGNVFPMTNDLTYDEKDGEDGSIYGTVDIGGYVFNVDGASSDKKSAELNMVNPLFPAGGTLKNVMVEDDTTMTGDYAIPDIQFSGDFTLSLEGGGKE